MCRKKKYYLELIHLYGGKNKLFMKINRHNTKTLTSTNKFYFCLKTGASWIFNENKNKLLVAKSVIRSIKSFSVHKQNIYLNSNGKIIVNKKKNDVHHKMQSKKSS